MDESCEIPSFIVSADEPHGFVSQLKLYESARMAVPGKPTNMGFTTKDQPGLRPQGPQSIPKALLTKFQQQEGSEQEWFASSDLFSSDDCSMPDEFSNLKEDNLPSFVE